MYRLMHEKNVQSLKESSNFLEIQAKILEAAKVDNSKSSLC